MTTKRDELTSKIVSMVIKHDAMLTGVGNILANHAILIREQLEKCSGIDSDCEKPATIKDLFAINAFCDKCLAKKIAKFPINEQESEISNYFDLPHAVLTRSLNDYIELIENVVPSVVH
jgi:hypothetical protein